MINGAHFTAGLQGTDLARVSKHHTFPGGRLSLKARLHPLSIALSAYRGNTLACRHLSVDQCRAFHEVRSLDSEHRFPPMKRSPALPIPPPRSIPLSYLQYRDVSLTVSILLRRPCWLLTAPQKRLNQSIDRSLASTFLHTACSIAAGGGESEHLGSSRTILNLEILQPTGSATLLSELGSLSLLCRRGLKS